MKLKCPKTNIKLALPNNFKSIHKFKNTSSKINPMTLIDINKYNK